MTLILLSLTGLVMALVVLLGVLSVRDHRRRHALGSGPGTARRGSAALRLTSCPGMGAVAPGRYVDDSA